MTELLPLVIASSIEIAWDYLDVPANSATWTSRVAF